MVKLILDDSTGEWVEPEENFKSTDIKEVIRGLPNYRRCSSNYNRKEKRLNVVINFSGDFNEDIHELFFKFIPRGFRFFMHLSNEVVSIDRCFRKKNTGEVLRLYRSVDRKSEVTLDCCGYHSIH